MHIYVQVIDTDKHYLLEERFMYQNTLLEGGIEDVIWYTSIQITPLKHTWEYKGLCIGIERLSVAIVRALLCIDTVYPR